MPKQWRTFIGRVVGGNIVNFIRGERWQEMVVAAKAYRPIGQAAQRVAIDSAADAGRFRQMPIQYLLDPIVGGNAMRRGQRNNLTAAYFYSRRPHFVDECVLWLRHQLNLRKVRADNVGAPVVRIVHHDQLDAPIGLSHQTAEAVADTDNRVAARDNNRQRNRHGENVCRLTVSPRVADA